MNIQGARLTPLRLWAILAVLLLFVALVSIWGSMLQQPAATLHPPLVPVVDRTIYDGPAQAAPRAFDAGDGSEYERDDYGE